MRRLRLTSKLLLYVLASAAVVAALTAWLYRAADTAEERGFAVTAGGLAMVLLVLVGIFIRHQLARPLHDLADAARRLGEGDLHADVGVRSRDELGDLASAFREMTRDLRLKYAELREANVELERRNRFKSQFLANMSHELRTPLHAIIGFAEAIRDGLAGPTTVEQLEFAGDIHKAGRQLLRLIDDILDFTKLESGATELVLEPCDLAGLVDEVLRVTRGLAQRRGVTMSADIRPRPLELTADPVKLRQVFYNLLSNAIKFTDAGGRVTVRARLEKEVVRIEVADTGVGIAPSDLADIFTEFTQVDASLTRRHEGAGLGLALVRRLVRLHGGDIHVASDLGRGSTFVVTLLRDLVPAADAGRADPDAAAPAGAPASPHDREATDG